MKTPWKFSSGSAPAINTITRRDFLSRTLRGSAALGLAALTQVPPFARRALAEGNIGINGKKLLFIFLRGANDALNSCIPILDSSYNSANRPNILIPAQGGLDYTASGPCDFQTGGASTFAYANAIRLGNGFNALHPSLKFLAPVYNAGDALMVHRVGYPRQSRSHFDSQAYWESGDPNTATREGIFYRTLIESGLTTTNPLTGVSIQSALPTLLKGSAAAMTNLSDPTRYDLLGTPSPSADLKLMNSILAADQKRFVDKRSRVLLQLSYENLVSTLDLFSTIDFTEAGNTFVDDVATDIGGTHYPLFPTTGAKNGGGTTATQVVDAGAYSFFQQLKGAALILNKTDAIIAGTEMGGFDTHDNEGGVTGAHANLQTRIAWAMYALQKYFKIYGLGGSSPAPAAKVSWNDVVVVTLSEFGRTTIQNSNGGTDHAEAGVMWVAGGGVKGRGKAGRTSGIIAGTEITGFDTHDNEGGVTGAHANLQSRIAWAMYALRKYFLLNGDKTTWDNLVVVTLSEFGRTTIQNSNGGTDHAEAGVMWVAGGGVKGRGKAGRTSGVIAGTPSGSIPWATGPGGSMFGVSGRYLQRAVDYRSVLGEIIREHMGATQNQLDRIIPGYADAGENLLGGGVSGVDATPIMGEVDVV